MEKRVDKQTLQQTQHEWAGQNKTAASKPGAVATDGASNHTPLVVYYDGSCPLCRREIAFYRRRTDASAVNWVDVSSAGADVARDLDRSRALARFHVRLPDGTLADGARGFTALWRRVPGWRTLGRIGDWPLVAVVLEGTYRLFLFARPALQYTARWLEPADGARWPRWLEQELRSNHAGEAGAVAIYRGILAVGRDAALRGFAERHLAAEQSHLETMETLVPPEGRSRLLPVWRLAGYLTGLLPTLFSLRATYATIDAVETFVDHHYSAQIETLGDDPRYAELASTLRTCREDELEHRDEARTLAQPSSHAALRAWVWLIGVGSSTGVAIAKRI